MKVSVLPDVRPGCQADDDGDCIAGQQIQRRCFEDTFFNEDEMEELRVAAWLRDVVKLPPRICGG